MIKIFISILVVYFLQINLFASSLQVMKPIQVTLDSNTTSMININKYYVPERTKGDTCVFVHGMVHNGNTFQPINEWILNNYPNVKAVYTLDMPGHGKSTLNSSTIKFGQLSLEHYTQAVIGVLDALKLKDTSISCIGAHSLGSMVLQNLQNNLVLSGSSIFEEWGIDKAIFFAPVIPEGLTWSYAEGIVSEYGPISELLIDVIPFLTHDILLGTYLTGSGSEFLDLFFSYNGEYVVANSPSVATVENYLLDKEPLLISLELAGLDSDLKRPIIQEHIFTLSLGTELITVIADGDPFMEISEVRDLQYYLTGWEEGFYEIYNENSSHDVLYNFYLIGATEIMSRAISDLFN